jgi:hypothetical protein
MATKTLLDVIKQKKTRDSVIQKILGRDKYIMLNAEMLRKLGPEAACFLTFVLDRADFLEQSNQISTVGDEGLFLYRSDINAKVGISPYTQRKVEKILSDLDIMIVVEEKLKDNQTRNRYYVDIFKLDDFLEK